MSPPRTPPRPRAFAADDPDIKPSDAPADAARPTSPQDAAAPSAAGAARPGRDQAPAEAAPPATQTTPPPRLLTWGRVLLGALGGLVLLMLGAALTDFVASALGRGDWIGVAATALLAIAALAALVLAGRELVGLLRLQRLSRLRRDAEAALRIREARLEQAVARRLVALARSAPDRRWDVARFREEERHMREPGQLLGLADRVLLAEPDRQARRIVYESARRVGVLTAVVPIAALDVVLVLAETLRMIRRLAEAYGGRPGILGGLRLLWWVIGHIAATGAIALTDDLVGQILGQGLARGLSRRLGEGAVNAALTARLGAAAIELIRPLPYVEAPRIRARTIVAELLPDLSPAELTRTLLRRPKR